MDIGGIQKDSLIDFPGAVACVIFTRGCNFICPYCHNPDLVAGGPKAGSRITEDEVFAFLSKRKGLLDGVAITGGEPTLQPDLKDFITQVRELGFKVKLDTNGSRPQIIQSLLSQGLVDYMAMDIKTSPGQYPTLMKEGLPTGPILESIRIIMETAPDYEFRTTCVSPFVDEDRMREIADLVKGAKRYILQKCSENVTVLDPSFFSGTDRFLSETRMQALKKILDNAVEQVRTR